MPSRGIKQLRICTSGMCPSSMSSSSPPLLGCLGCHFSLEIQDFPLRCLKVFSLVVLFLIFFNSSGGTCPIYGGFNEDICHGGDDEDWASHDG